MRRSLRMNGSLQSDTRFTDHPALRSWHMNTRSNIIEAGAKYVIPINWRNLRRYIVYAARILFLIFENKAMLPMRSVQ